MPLMHTETRTWLKTRVSKKTGNNYHNGRRCGIEVSGVQNLLGTEERSLVQDLYVFWFCVQPLTVVVEPVLYWRDVFRSGILFSIGNLFFFLLTVGQYSLLTLVTYVFLTLMLVSYAYITFAQFRGQANPFEYVSVFAFLMK